MTSHRPPRALAPGGFRLAVALILATAACDNSPTSAVLSATRAYRMGLSAIPPTADQATAVASLDMWSTSADAAIMHVDVQWTLPGHQRCFS